MGNGAEARPDGLRCWRQTGTVFLTCTHTPTHKVKAKPQVVIAPQCWTTADSHVFSLHIFHYKLSVEHKSRFGEIRVKARLSKPQFSTWAN